jgi:hypothetical protein
MNNVKIIHCIADEHAYDTMHIACHSFICVYRFVLLLLDNNQNGLRTMCTIGISDIQKRHRNCTISTSEIATKCMGPSLWRTQWSLQPYSSSRVSSYSSSRVSSYSSSRLSSYSSSIGGTTVARLSAQSG